MSQVNGDNTETIRRHNFYFDGDRVLSANLSDLRYDIVDLEEEIIPREGDVDADGKPKTVSMKDWLKAVVDMVRDRYKVEITRGEAEDLVAKVRIAYAKKKNTAEDEWRSAARLPRSTESVPATSN